MTAYRNCVACGSGDPAPLFMVQLRGVPHGQPGHNVVYDYKDISECRSCGCGQLEVHSHDCWSLEEPWNMYWWYAFYPAGVEALKYLLGNCPAPRNPACECDIHRFMRHELRDVYSGISHGRTGQDAERFCWLRFAMNEGDNSVSIERDEANGIAEVVRQDRK